MSDDVRSDLSELAALHLRDACKLVGSSEWKMRKEIERGEYESYLDGNRRKVTLRSIKARQERLIKAQTPSPTIPPPPQRSKQEATTKIHPGSGAVFRHGLPEDRVDWFLSPDLSARSPDHEARKSETFGGPKLLDCTQCGALRQGGKACPNCGFLPVRKPELVGVRDGDLALVTNGKSGKTEVNAREWLAMLTAIGLERGYKPGWAAHKFKEKFRTWPPSRNVIPIEPSPEVRSWVRSRAIAWAKSQEPR